MPVLCRFVLAACAVLLGCGDRAPVTVALVPPGSSGAPRFTEVTEAAGLGSFRHENGAFGQKYFPEPMGAGGGFLDYDGDGWEDVVLVAGAHWPGHGEPIEALRLYRNRRDGTFEEVTEEAGLSGLVAYGTGVVAADYDNDGDQDLYFTTLHENFLLRNEDGVFTEVGALAGVRGSDEWSSSSLFFDADRDGWLDLFVGGYARWRPEEERWCTQDGETREYCVPASYEGQNSRFYRNNGDGTFTDRTREAGFWPVPGKALGVVELDLENDGWPDLYVANDGQPNLLYRNVGDGTFEEIGVMSGAALGEQGEARAGMGVDAGVVDPSGETTIFVGNFSSEMSAAFRHLGSGIFEDRAAASRIGYPTLNSLTFAVLLLDVDLDGDLDFFMANGHVYPSVDRMNSGTTYRQRAQLFLNGGDGFFTEVEGGDPLDRPMVARAAAYADYDKDGDLDLLITENDGPAHLWRNDTEGGRSLRIRLEGRESNRDGLDTRLLAYVGGRALEQRVRTGSGYLSQSEKVATFGMGSAAAVDSLVVAWPSGRVERFLDVRAGRELRLVEGSGRLEGTPPLAAR